ncbi:Hsp33 family molecular chaperone HslO [Roseateles sp. DXS20W]|uniref:Hsp33 family molecular chaperone HslO n=1 Tax=Pelomonas lactea TaxID=3299030 RepID=A0ABW7GH72_9BURK
MSELHKFLFDGLPVRGMLVRLTDSWREMLGRREPGQDYPPELRDMLGEMSAAAVLMQANIKFNGALVLQVFGDGPVKLAVAEAQPDLSYRATAKCVGSVEPGATLEAMVNLRGQGRCAITLDPKDKFPGQQPYQGVVPLHGDQREPLQKMSEVLEHYMLQSEQLDTKLVLAANGDIAAGLLIQRLPVEGEGNLEGRRNEDDIGLSDAFNRISMLAATLTAEELLTLDADTVLRRLFWEETVTRFEPLSGSTAPRFACTCSRERVGQMLLGLGREEVDSVLAERGDVEIGCDFCGRHYRFDAVDVGALFTPAGQQPEGGAAASTLQ